MPKDNYKSEISALNSEIENRGDVWELYYKRGYFFYLSKDEEKAKDDYLRAIALGLNPTEVPYYSFSCSNTLRRDFLLPEKVLVVLILIVVFIALSFQVTDFVLWIKSVLNV